MTKEKAAERANKGTCFDLSSRLSFFPARYQMGIIMIHIAI
jgi:hypothetical protein